MVEETILLELQYKSFGMNSLDMTSLASNDLRSVVGSSELEFDLWEGQFTFGSLSNIQESNTMVQFFKGELSALVNKVNSPLDFLIVLFLGAKCAY